MTISLWVQGGAPSLSPDLDYAYGGIMISKGEHGDEYHVRQFASGLRFRLGTDTHEPHFYPAIVVGEWVHVVALYDGRYMRIYKDGVLQNQVTTMHEQPLANVGGDLVIGKRSPIIDSFSTVFAGTLDEIRIYNRALTDREITALAEQ